MRTWLFLAFKFASRNRLRTVLTMLSVSIVMVTFVLLRTLVASWQSQFERSSNLWIVRNRVSAAFPLSRAHHVEKLRVALGADKVSWSSWFGGFYIDERNRFDKLAVDAESYYRIHPEFQLPPAQMQEFLRDPAGAVAGDLLAQKYGWKAGDKIVLQGTIYPGIWEFTLRGIYTAREEIDRREFQFHWRYLNEKVEEGRKDQVGMILASTSEDQAAAIDKLFSGSLAETRTESEGAWQRSFMSMVNHLMSAIEAISAAIVIVMVLILGNTMAMAIRERTTEYASMRAIGYRHGHITALVVAEGLLMAGVGVGIALLVISGVLGGFSRLLEEYLGEVLALRSAPGMLAVAVVVALASGTLAATVPAWRLRRVSIAQALRRIE